MKLTYISFIGAEKLPFCGDNFRSNNDNQNYVKSGFLDFDQFPGVFLRLIGIFQIYIV